MKIKNLSIIPMILVLMAYSIACKKESAPSPTGTSVNPNSKSCAVNNTATITVDNNSSNPYNLYINGKLYGKIPGGGLTNPIEIPSGDVTLKGVQVSGYVFSPTIKEETVTTTSCVPYSWDLP